MLNCFIWSIKCYIGSNNSENLKNMRNPRSPPNVNQNESAHIFLGIGTGIAIVLGLLALILSGSNNQLLQHPHRLSLYDVKQQPLLGANTWTNINYNHTLFTSPDFILLPGGGAIRCLKNGIYTMFFKIQIDLNTSVTPPLPPQCGSCFLKYAARATIQYQGVGLITEIPTSFTYDNNGLHLSTQLFFNSSYNDLIRIQFISACPYLILTPYSINGNSSSQSVSTTLLIY